MKNTYSNGKNCPKSNCNNRPNLKRNSFIICKSKVKTGNHAQRTIDKRQSKYKLTSCSLFTCESSDWFRKNNLNLKSSNLSLKHNSNCSEPNAWTQTKSVLKEKSLHHDNPSIMKVTSSNSTNARAPHWHIQISKKKEPETNILKSLISSFEIPKRKHLKDSGSINYVKNHNSDSSVFQTQKKEQFREKKQGLPITPNQHLNGDNVSGSHNTVLIKTWDFENVIAQAYKLNESKFLFDIKPARHLCFIGVIELEVLQGSVEILGCKIDKTQHKTLAYSLQGSCHLSLRANAVDTPECEDYFKEALCKKLVSLGLPIKTATKILKESVNNTLLIISKKKSDVSSTVWPILFENHLSYSLFPPVELLCEESRQCHIIEHSIDCIFEERLQELGFKQFNEISEWLLLEKDVVSEEAGVTKTILCGGKSVGKSTLLRYLVNKCLMRWQRVVVIDCDLGQCEFTLPGCISVTLVEQPLLGPNYTHLKEPLRSVYLGEVDVTKCPESYSDGCNMLVKYAKEHYEAVPWIVNTMGFTKGFGVTLTCGIIKTVGPTHVVQIDSKDRKLNFPSRLEPSFVQSQDTKSFKSVGKSLEYKLLTMPSGSELTVHKTRGLSPAESRNLVILSYLSGMLSSEVHYLTQVTPYMINMDLLTLQTTTKYNLTKMETAATMNGNLVALCSLAEGDTFPNCLGFGVVRAIDWKANIMFVITPLPGNTLSKVNCLVKGNTGLPESLYFNQGEVEGRVPYLAKTSGGATARFAKRDFRIFPASPQTGVNRRQTHLK